MNTGGQKPWAKVYPNPARRDETVTLVPANIPNGKVSIETYNSVGIEIESSQEFEVSSSQSELRLVYSAELAAGFYLVKAALPDGKILTAKFVIE